MWVLGWVEVTVAFHAQGINKSLIQHARPEDEETGNERNGPDPGRVLHQSQCKKEQPLHVSWRKGLTERKQAAVKLPEFHPWVGKSPGEGTGYPLQ